MDQIGGVYGTHERCRWKRNDAIETDLKAIRQESLDWNHLV
jgi:hypothetical protein